MAIKTSRVIFSLFVISLSVCPVQGTPEVRPILRLEEMSNGPFKGQKSVSCLTINSDGKIKYYHRWNPGKVGVDAQTGKKVLVEETVSVESYLSRADLFELPDFLESEGVKGLNDSIVILHVFIDYHESATLYVNGSDGKEKEISIYDYGTAGLERKSQLPGALIVLMDKIEEIKKEATLKGKAMKTPLNCQEVRK